MKVRQQVSNAFRTESWNVGESGTLHAFTPLLAVKADRKAMGFVTQPAQKRHAQLVRFALNRIALPWKEDFLPLLGQ